MTYVLRGIYGCPGFCEMANLGDGKGANYLRSAVAGLALAGGGNALAENANQPLMTAEQYQARIAELTAQKDQINCTGKTGLALGACASQKSALESQIRLARKQREGAESEAQNEHRLVRNNERAKRVESKWAKGAEESERANIAETALAVTKEILPQ